MSGLFSWLPGALRAPRRPGRYATLMTPAGHRLRHPGFLLTQLLVVPFPAAARLHLQPGALQHHLGSLLFVALGLLVALYLRRRDQARPPAPLSTAHGSARWGDPRALLQPRGLIVGETPRGLLRFDDDAHLLTIAPTGSGKGVGAVLPNLLDYPGSVLVTDIKGENYAVTARFRRDVLGHDIAGLDPFGLVGGAASYNPLDLIDPASDEAYDSSRLLANQIVIPEPGQSEPFWDEEAASLIAAMILYVAVAAAPAERHLGTVRHLLTLGSLDLELLLDAMTATDACQGLVRRAANRIRQKEERLLAGVLASTNRHTEFLDSPHILRTLRSSSFRMEDLADWRLSLYLVLPPHHLRTHSRWLRLLIATALRLLTHTPRQPAHRVLFLLDEFAALGRMQPVEEALTYGRAYGLSVWLLVQDLAQLRELYRTSWETLLANTRLKQAFGTADDFTADYLSRLTGQATVRVRSHNRSRGSSSTSASWLPNQQRGLADQSAETSRRLLFPDEIRRLPADQQLLFVAGQLPLRTRRVNYLLRTDLLERAEPNPIYEI
ncbi:MAG TPA: type IV secretory system conjugative DNA transfer family protein [Thermoanaerobaculia bacterium]|nr:type IV secretory system conjugative DNA transfer family protein [Thermoanaerobaculia bacterium]